MRARGTENGFKMIFTKPFGYDNSLRSPGYGFLFLTSSYSGIIGVFLLIFILYKTFKQIFDIHSTKKSYGYIFFISLLLSSFFSMLFINGYSCDRPSGLIIIFILYFSRNMLSSVSLK
jgi:hypothetical protein